MKTRAIAAALLFSLAPVTLGLPAYAQDEATTRQARARFQEGVDAFDKGQYENARASFLQAYALRKHPAVLLNLAQSSLRSGHPLEAAKYFQQYLREAQNITAAQKADAENGLNESRGKIGRIEIVAPSGTEISVDGERVGVAPFSEALDVEPGPRTLKSRASDGSNETVRITVGAGQRLSAKFGPQAAPPPVIAPVLPPATTTPTPPPPATVPPTEPAADDQPGASRGLFSPPDTMVPVYIGTGLAVVGTGLAIGFYLAKNSAQDSATSIETEIRTKGGFAGVCTSTKADVVAKFGKACKALSDDNDKVDADAMIGNVAVGVAIVGAVGAIGWYLFGPKKNDPKKTGKWETPLLTPQFGPKYGGLSIAGSF